MSLSKQLARKFAFPILNAIGFDKIIRNRSKHSRLVLMFHGVSSKDTTWFSPRHMEVHQFEQLMVYLKNNFTILTAKEMAAEKLEEKSEQKKKSICITFDDGYWNNLTIVLPILEKYSIPATFFISTICPYNPKEWTLWADAVSALQKVGHNHLLEIKGLSFTNGVAANGKTVVEAIKELSCQERDTLLQGWYEKYKLEELLLKMDKEIWQMMNIEELKRFAKSPMVAIGSHGHMHYNLGKISHEEALADVEMSKALLEEWLGERIDQIAFPDGSYTEQLKDSLFEKGIKHQYAVNYNSDSERSDRKIIDRFGVSSTTTLHANIFHINKAFQKHGF